MIYLKHPQHGEKFALVESEAVADEKNGWVRAELNRFPKKVTIVSDGAMPESSEPAESEPAIRTKRPYVRKVKHGDGSNAD